MTFRSLVPALLMVGFFATGAVALAEPVQVAQTAAMPACVPAQSPIVPLALRITNQGIDGILPTVQIGASVRESCTGTPQQVTYTGPGAPYTTSWWVVGAVPPAGYRGP